MNVIFRTYDTEGNLISTVRNHIDLESLRNLENEGYVVTITGNTAIVEKEEA